MPELVIDNPDEASRAGLRPQPGPVRAASGVDRLVGLLVEIAVLALLSGVSAWVWVRARLGDKP